MDFAIANTLKEWRGAGAGRGVADARADGATTSIVTQFVTPMRDAAGRFWTIH
jgi:hypothetical protein